MIKYFNFALIKSNVSDRRGDIGRAAATGAAVLSIAAATTNAAFPTTEYQ